MFEILSSILALIIISLCNSNLSYETKENISDFAKKWMGVVVPDSTDIKYLCGGIAIAAGLC